MRNSEVIGFFILYKTKVKPMRDKIRVKLKQDSWKTDFHTQKGNDKEMSV